MKDGRNSLEEMSIQSCVEKRELVDLHDNDPRLLQLAELRWRQHYSLTEDAIWLDMAFPTKRGHLILKRLSSPERTFRTKRALIEDLIQQLQTELAIEALEGR